MEISTRRVVNDYKKLRDRICRRRRGGKKPGDKETLRFRSYV